MATEYTFKFSCPYCGQHLEAEREMIGMTFDCPECGQSLTVPKSVDVPRNDVALSESEVSRNSQDTKSEAEAVCHAPPAITVLRSRERFFDKCKNRFKAVGIGLAVLMLFVAVCAINNGSEEADGSKRDTAKPSDAYNAHAIMTSVENLINFLEVRNERRLQILINSLAPCPADFQDAMKELLAVASKSVDDMISDEERDEALKGSLVVGLLFGAISDSAETGTQAGSIVWNELQSKARTRLKREIESKRNRFLDVAQKYGVDSTKLENALISNGL